MWEKRGEKGEKEKGEGGGEKKKRDLGSARVEQKSNLNASAKQANKYWREKEIAHVFSFSRMIHSYTRVLGENRGVKVLHFFYIIWQKRPGFSKLCASRSFGNGRIIIQCYVMLLLRISKNGVVLYYTRFLQKKSCGST